MKTLTALLVSTVLNIQVSGYLIKVPTAPSATPIVTGPTQWVHLQKLMIPLFENVCEITSNPVIQRLAQELSLEPTDYLKPEVINNLQKLISTGLLPKGIIFTEYDPDHMNELKIIYEVLYNAKDFDTFYKVAAWARQNVNCGLYVSAIYMAIQNRRDTERISIPAPYELLPNYFIDKDVIIKASSIVGGEEITPTDNVRYEGNSYILDANYTAEFYKNDDDAKLAYFREDIGLNSYYFLRKLKLAPWTNDEVNGGFGENMFQMMKQFMARYNLERYANGFPEIDGIQWKSVTNIPYDPKLIYSDGNEFSHRTSSLNLPESEDLLLLQTIENNIVAVVSHLRQSGYNKTQILNHLMEILVTSDRSYETLARRLLGKDLTNNGHGSVLKHYMTSLRDPMFWKINKRIVDMVDEALKLLPKYTRNELYFPGVEVVNVEVKKMTTACDYFMFDVTDALKLAESNSTFKIKIGQPRLNHKQFTIKVNISSLVTQKGLVKIYLGPKLMPGELAAKKNLFTLLDMFEITLKKGTNIIARSSENMKQFSQDFMLLDTIRRKVEDAEYGLDSLPLSTIQSQVGYPSRLILPKGTPQGLPLQMFVFIAPYIRANVGDSYTKNSMEFNTAVLSPGYPLDLMIEDKQIFELPNTMIKYITVTQKSDNKVENYGGPGVTKSWYGTDTYDSPSRPNYNSKNGQYGRKTDYSGKINEFNVGKDEITFYNENLDDDYDVIALDDVPSLRLTSRIDYSSKNKFREPFDYRTKKAQYDNKDYSTKKDYTQYRVKPKDDNVITSTPTIEMLSTTTNFVSTIDESSKKLNKNIKKNFIDKQKNNDLSEEQVMVNDLLEVEPLPLPAMLKKDLEENDLIDNKVRKMERDNIIKARKNELDNLIKDAKLRRYLNNLTVKTTSEATPVNSKEKLGKVVLSKDGIKFDNQITQYPKLNPVNLENIDKTDIIKDNIEVDRKNRKYNFIDKQKNYDLSEEQLMVKDLLEAEPLPLQAMLKKDLEEQNKFDNKARKTERDNIIKARKNELDNLIKDAKLRRYLKNLTVKTTSEVTPVNSEKKLDKEILSKDDLKLENQITQDLKLKPANLENIDKGDIIKDSIEVNGEITNRDSSQEISDFEDPIFTAIFSKSPTPTLYNYLKDDILGSLR